MPLNKVKLENDASIDKFIIFASHNRHSCRSILVNFLFNCLATGPRSNSTGLFLLLKSIKLRSTVFLPIKLIKQANTEGWFRSLAYFVRMKSLYVNNTHYNYNLRNLSKKLNCSPACLSHHIKQLRHRGLVADHSGNMTFKGFNRLGKLWGHKAVGVPVDHDHQLDLLRAQIIRFNLQQQEYNIKKSGVQQCPRGPISYTFSEKANSCYTGLSVHGFGKAIGLSPSQGGAIRAKMIQLGILSATRRYSFYGGASGGPSGEGLPDGVLRTALIHLKIQGLMPSYAFVKDGSIWVERRMELEYLRA